MLHSLHVSGHSSKACSGSRSGGLTSEDGPVGSLSLSSGPPNLLAVQWQGFIYVDGALPVEIGPDAFLGSGQRPTVDIHEERGVSGTTLLGRLPFPWSTS